MKPINLYEFSKAVFLPEKELQTYERFNSNRNSSFQIKNREIETIRKFVSLLSQYVEFEYWNGFYYSFSIPQISKEFDLLKVGNNKILNIELKSEHTSDQKLLSQLRRNKYYLSHLGRDVIAIVFVGDTNQLLKLKDDKLYKIEINEVIQDIKGIDDFYAEDIEKLFNPTQFLVSPINTPDKFIEGNYFLTDHQEEIRDAIIKSRNADLDSFAFYQVVGGAGTGKTLLIYDIAKQFSKSLKICIIHCGLLAEGHKDLDEKLDNVSIIAAKALKYLNYDYFDSFDGIIIDEAHRIYKGQLENICKKIKAAKKFCVFGMDGEQYLTKSEARSNINEIVNNLERCKHFRLTNKIRTNKELSDFIHLIRKINEPVETKAFPNVKILYADTYEYANRLIMNYEKNNYKYISFTPSKYYRHSIDDLIRGENTHEVIGQEFDNVIMVINESFEYFDDGRLGAYEHPVPDYLFAQLLYQGLTRVREKLAVIILNNEKLFIKLLGAIENITNS